MGISTKQLRYSGGILFSIGAICIITSWMMSYPLTFSAISTPTFFQFHPVLWPGIVFCLIGLFTIGLYSKHKVVLFLTGSSIPFILYSYKSFFSYLPSSDAGNVRALFEIVSSIGLDSSVDPYFQYPIYFLSNYVTENIVGWNMNTIALVSFFLYGVLIAMFLFLYIAKFQQKYHFYFQDLAEIVIE